MKQWTLSSRRIPFDDAWDVVVVGGGPAGCTAAAAAAREGARTLLVEVTGALGGMGTNALVPAWTPFSDKQQIIYRGLAQRVFEDCKAGMAHVRPTDMDWVPIDPERLKRIYDDLVTSHGAKVLFHTMLAAVETDGKGQVEAIVVNNKGGLSALKAKVFVDCTGDADLCAWAGAECFNGNDEGHGLMPATHCFVLTNVDEEAYRTVRNLHGNNPESPIYRILQSGKYPLIPDSHLCSNLIGPRTVGFNAGHLWGVDNTRPETIGKALINGRRMAQQYRDALAEFCPGAFGDAFLVTTGSLMGVRETRRVIGDYVLTLDDYVRRRSFEDEVCRNSYFIDVHWAADHAARDPQRYADWDRKAVHYQPGESHGIPYRCLTPRDLSNVLTAGRAISCEKIVQGSVRVMPVCLAMGEAAGVAAAQATSMARPDVHAVNTAMLRRALRERGAHFH